MTSQVFPLTAWESAGIVTLFCLFVLYLLYWFTKQSTSWQNFMKDLNQTWLDFNKKQREENNSAMTDVKTGLQDLAKVTGQLLERIAVISDNQVELAHLINDHDRHTRETLANFGSGGKRRVSSAPRSNTEE